VYTARKATDRQPLAANQPLNIQTEMSDPMVEQTSQELTSH